MTTSWKTTVMATALVWAVAGWASASRAVSESHPLTAGGEVSVESLAGSLTIEGWDGAEVQISGTLGDGVKDLEVESDGDGVSIEVKYDEDFHGREATKTDLTIRVPRSAGLSVETVSAGISVSGMRGDVELESVSGAIVVADAPSALEVESVSGKVTVDTAGPSWRR